MNMKINFIASVIILAGWPLCIQPKMGNDDTNQCKERANNNMSHWTMKQKHESLNIAGIAIKIPQSVLSTWIDSENDMIMQPVILRAIISMPGCLAFPVPCDTDCKTLKFVKVGMLIKITLLHFDYYGLFSHIHVL